LTQGLLLDEKKTKLSTEEQFNRIDARHRKKKKRQEKYSWMSLGWLRFFGTSVNKEEKENSCGLRAEKFFARTKHSSSRLHSSWSKDNVLPVKTCKRCRSSTRAQENKDIWDLSNIGLDEKIQLFGRRESKMGRRKNRSWSSHISTS